MKIRRFERTEGIVSLYIHGGGTVGVIVNIDTDDVTAKNETFKVMGKDVAMQIAAMSPQYLSKSDVPEEVVNYEKGIFMAQLNEDEKMKDKPEKVLEGIISGKISKMLKEICLLDKQYVKNGEISV